MTSVLTMTSQQKELVCFKDNIITFKSKSKRVI